MSLMSFLENTVNTIFNTERPFSEWKLSDIAGAPAILLEESESTHIYMKAHFTSLTPGALIVANTQTSGRGRHDRIWCSPMNKNLYFNLLLPLEGLQRHQYTQVMQVAAITIAHLLQEIEVNASVKWPNDILWEKHKISGMISELLIYAPNEYLSLGIGINVNSEASDFKNLNRLASSLRLILNRPLNREALLQKIVNRIALSLKRFKKEGVKPWIADWKKMDHFIGNEARMIEGDTVIHGTIMDINDNGSLLFQTQNGELMTRYSGDLEI